MKYTYPAWLIAVIIRQETKLIFFFKILKRSHKSTIENDDDAKIISPSSVKLKIMFETKYEKATKNPFFFKSKSAKANAIENGLIISKMQALASTKKQTKSKA